MTDLAPDPTDGTFAEGRLQGMREAADIARASAAEWRKVNGGGLNPDSSRFNEAVTIEAKINVAMNGPNPWGRAADRAAALADREFARTAIEQEEGN